jgi:hypothetical protein
MILSTRADVVMGVTYENGTDETGWSLEHSEWGFGRVLRCVLPDSRGASCQF